MYLLQAVRVSESQGYEKARQVSQKYIKNRRKKYWTVEDGCYVFRNTALRHMTNLRSKQVEEGVTLVFGTLLPKHMPPCPSDGVASTSETDD